MMGLKYFDGAVPGKKKKKQGDVGKNSEYEKNWKDRTFNEKWREDRLWLHFSHKNLVKPVDQDEPRNEPCERSIFMTCKYCTAYEKVSHNKNNTNTFITGYKNWRLSAVTDHEKNNFHQKATDFVKSRSLSVEEKSGKEAGRTLLSLQKADISRLQTLFRNLHAVVKNNRPLSDYVWLCRLDKAKGIDLGETYLNDKAAIVFTTAIAESEKKKTVKCVDSSNFYAVMMDGSTDISGDEQETLYIRLAYKGEIKEKFVCIGTPDSTAAEDLKTFVLNSLHENGINKGLNY